MKGLFKMDVCVKTNFDVYSPLVEPERNDFATGYMLDHHDTLMKYIGTTLGIAYPEDMFNDVFLSLMSSENQGRGYSDEYGDGGISVAQFVYGRIKGYAKNKKYSSSAEILNGSAVVAASSNGEDVEDMDSFQKAYAMASVSDTITSTDDSCAIRDELEYLIDMCNFYDIKIVHILKNMDKLAGMSKKALSAAMVDIKAIAERDTEFGEILRSVLAFSSTNRDKLIALLDEIGGPNNGACLLASC